MEPNPSLKWSANGRLPGPGLWCAHIFTARALVACRRRPLSSNARHHKTRPVASPAGSAARSAEDQTATARHSREQPALLVHLHGSGQNRAKRYAPCMKERVNFQSSQISASREIAVALGARFVSQFLGPAAVRSAVASFSLVRGGRQDRGASAWSARSGLLFFWLSKVSNTGGTLRTLPLPPTVMPNPSFKPSPNGVSRWPSSAGPAAHFALAVQRATPSVPA